ncbi:MetA-pathway of phenol degradation, putative [Gemmatirosa kalamazoonensis]|uniref:MetA-pathway of phenol degradation, putative n=1 Tax=Gemmatirosa kalamazoonensis TaxID=861299 RepID=W0RHV0_9BACT|nr:transporter [Gemmatirosa kalamazoonensis]AHG90346.1 MetA-pathway of phenol degradation, putative [Gemmatirosa kalamazoonensis]
MPPIASLEAPRAPTHRLAVALPLAALLLAGCAAAAYHTPLTGADRPGYTFGTATVPAGGLQAELGYTDTRLGSLTYQSLGEGLLRVGVGPSTELRVFGNSYALRSDGGLHDDGMEDAKIGIKHRLWAGRASSGIGGASLALLPGISVPIGSAGFGAKAWQPELLVAGALPLSPRLSLVSNVGDAYVKLGDERAHKLLGTLAGWYTLSAKLSAFAEYGGSRLADDAKSHMQYVDAGIAVVPLPAVQLDVRVGHGINGVANDNYVGLGISRRW